MADGQLWFKNHGNDVKPKQRGVAFRTPDVLSRRQRDLTALTVIDGTIGFGKLAGREGFHFDEDERSRIVGNKINFGPIATDFPVSRDDYETGALQEAVSQVFAIASDGVTGIPGFPARTLADAVNEPIKPL